MFVYDAPPAWIQYDFYEDHRIDGADLVELLYRWDEYNPEDLATLLSVWGWSYAQHKTGDERWYVWTMNDDVDIEPDQTWGQSGFVFTWDRRFTKQYYENPVIYKDSPKVHEGYTVQPTDSHIYDW